MNIIGIYKESIPNERTLPKNRACLSTMSEHFPTCVIFYPTKRAFPKCVIIFIQPSGIERWCEYVEDKWIDFNTTWLSTMKHKEYHKFKMLNDLTVLKLCWFRKNIFDRERSILIKGIYFDWKSQSTIGIIFSYFLQVI